MSSQLNLPHATKQIRVMKKLKTENGDVPKKRSSHKAVESVLRPGRESVEGRFVKEVDLEAGVKERGSYGW